MASKQEVGVKASEFNGHAVVQPRSNYINMELDHRSPCQLGGLVVAAIFKNLNFNYSYILPMGVTCLQPLIVICSISNDNVFSDRGFCLSILLGQMCKFYESDEIFTLKAWNAQNGGAAVILVADDRVEPRITMDTPEKEDTKFRGSIKNQYYNQAHYDELRSEWSEFFYSFVGA